MFLSSIFYNMAVALEVGNGYGRGCFDKIVNKNIEVKGNLSKGNEKHFIEHYRKGDTCYKMTDT